MAANFVPQSMLYSTGFGNMPNTQRDRSAEQAYNAGVGGPQYNYGFDPFQASNLGRYTPPTLKNPNGGADQWNNFGGYSYNLPNSYGTPYTNSYNTFGQIGGFPEAPMQFGTMQQGMQETLQGLRPQNGQPSQGLPYGTGAGYNDRLSSLRGIGGIQNGQPQQQQHPMMPEFSGRPFIGRQLLGGRR